VSDESSTWETHCSRCGESYPRERESRICESCEKTLQMDKLLNGIRCGHCDGHGRVYGSWDDIERAMNGRDTVCPECGGTGRQEWGPDPDDVHPDLRMEVEMRVE